MGIKLTPKEEDEIMNKAFIKAAAICYGGLAFLFLIFVILTLVL